MIPARDRPALGVNRLRYPEIEMEKDGEFLDLEINGRTWRCPLSAIQAGVKDLLVATQEYVDSSQYAASVAVVFSALERNCFVQFLCADPTRNRDG